MNDAEAELHLPCRPWWICERCANAWPCPTTRRHLIETMALTDRAALMGGFFVFALIELESGEPGALHRRFLGWIRGTAAGRE